MKNRSVPQSYWNIVKKNHYEICGDYICEEIMEMHIFNERKRSMYLRLQVPVKMNK